jgi:Toprim-like
MTAKERVQRIKEACSIEWAWQYLNCPGKPGRNCLSPLRPEKKASFSVYQGFDGQRWFDQGIGRGGDVIDFWAAVKGLSNLEAMRELEEVLHLAEPPKPQGAYRPAGERLVYPEHFRRPTDDEILDLSLLRGLGQQCFWLAGQLGTLVIGEDPSCHQKLWWLTDLAKKGLEGKTFTGDPCKASGKKTYAYPGSTKSWAYGLITTNPSLDSLQTVVLVEGMPDYFSAIELAITSLVNISVVALLGASSRLSPEAIEKMQSKTVLILPHNDEAGQRAGITWATQLAGIAGRSIVQPIPDGAKDLNELVTTNDPELHRILNAIKEL